MKTATGCAAPTLRAPWSASAEDHDLRAPKKVTSAFSGPVGLATTRIDARHSRGSVLLHAPPFNYQLPNFHYKTKEVWAMVRLIFNTPPAGVANAVPFVISGNGRQALSNTSVNQASEQLALLPGGGR